MRKFANIFTVFLDLFFLLFSLISGDYFYVLGVIIIFVLDIVRRVLRGKS